MHSIRLQDLAETFVMNKFQNKATFSRHQTGVCCPVRFFGPFEPPLPRDVQAPSQLLRSRKSKAATFSPVWARGRQLLVQDCQVWVSTLSAPLHWECEPRGPAWYSWAKPLCLERRRQLLCTVVLQTCASLTHGDTV